ncbi:MAG: hypothetical protein JJE41_14490 [Candidatus Heimdallarchaeota archaeon]|nr:hypothetical protein [Candidatus Heimdallarchaeota archaeon]
MSKQSKFKKNKNVVFLISILIISFSTISKESPNVESIDPLFSLEAKCYKIKHLDYLNLIKQHLARIGIQLRIEFIALSEINFLAELIAFRDFDLEILEFPCSTLENPFNPVFFSENGSLNLAGYHTSMDWDENLGEGRNEWYIQTGLEMTPNDSQERIDLCWEWQHYMMDDILPILPLFTQKDNHSTFEFLLFNMREVRPVIGSRSPAPGFTWISIGLLVRKAISYAINREEIRRVVLGDEYEIIHHPTNPVLDEWLNPNSIRYCYNLDFARKLMTLGSPGIDFGGNGEPFEYPEWEEVCPSQPTTISVVGFDLIATLSVLTLLPISFHVYNKQRKKSSSLRN